MHRTPLFNKTESAAHKKMKLQPTFVSKTLAKVWQIQRWLHRQYGQLQKRLISSMMGLWLNKKFAIN